MKIGKIILGFLFLIGAGKEYINASREIGSLFAPGITMGIIILLLICTWLIGSGFTKGKFEFKSLNFLKFFTLSFIIFYLIAFISLFSNEENQELLKSISIANKEEYVVINEDFQITFPEKPIDTIDSTSYITGRRLHYEPQSNDNNTLYKITYKDYPNNMYHSDSLVSIEFDLDHTQLSFIEENGLELINMNYKSISGYPAKEFRYKSIQDDKIIRTIIVMVKNRVYGLRVDTKSSLDYNKSINRFLDSFSLRGVEENSPPFLNLPSEEELDNPPFIVNFHGKTERRVQVSETIYGKTGFVLEMNEMKDLRSGIISLAVGYTNLPTKEILSKNERDEILDDITVNMQMNYQKYRLISKEPVANDIYEGVKIISSYNLMDYNVKDIRIAFVTDNNKYIVILATVLNDKPIDKKVNSFINSFYLK